MISPKLTSTMSEVDQLTVLSRRGIERVAGGARCSGPWSLW